MPRNWQDGSEVDGQPAKTNEDGNRVEALWGGQDSPDDSDGHGHIVTNDGLNAAYLREPDGEVVVDDNPQSSTFTGSSDRTEMNAARIREAQRSQPRLTRRQREEREYYRKR